MYPLPCTHITKSELCSIKYQPLRLALDTIGLNSNFLRCIVFRDHRYQGLNMNDMYTTQGKYKIRYYVGHMQMKSETSKLMKIKKDYLELISWQGLFPLKNPRIWNDEWMEKSWIQSLGLFLDVSYRSITTKGKRIMGDQRENDTQLMDCVDNYKKQGKTYIQDFRLYLLVQYMADVSNTEVETNIKPIQTRKTMQRK